MRATLLCLLLARAISLDNGVGLTPPRGFNPWNCFGINAKGQCKLPLPWLPGPMPCHGFNETIILEVAHAIASSPLAAAGYSYVNLDCGWSTGKRDSSGQLVVNKTLYPHGMVWLGERIHALGLKFGMYSDAGSAQCCSRIVPGADDGSAGHEADDAALFASWGVDYLKHDDCSAVEASYASMRDALNATGRRVLYSTHPSSAADIGDASLANVWRTTSDINNTFASVLERAVLNDAYAASAAPGGFNDPDMLEVGNFWGPLSDAEGRSQMSLWCLMKAPLLIGTDVTNMSAATMATLTNPEALALSADPAGVQGRLRRNSSDAQVWSGTLVGGRVAAALLNTDGSTERNLTLRAADLPPEVASAAGKPTRWRVRDVWQSTTLPAQTLPLTRLVPPHDVALLVLTPLDGAVEASRHVLDS